MYIYNCNYNTACYGGDVMENYENNIMSDQTPTTHLEPRVAKLEAGLDILTRNVTDLTQAVRDNANNLEGKFERLTVAVTQAQAPKKTDWSMVISAVFLILALGSAVFWPLNQISQDNKISIQRLDSQIDAHERIEMHPTGLDKVKNMGEKYDTLVKDNQQNLDKLDKKLQRETELIANEIKSQVSSVSAKYDKEIQNLGDRLVNRMNTFDQNQYNNMSKDLDELRMWRLKALTGEIKIKTTPDVILQQPQK
jgi:hypothetical protein